MSRLQIMLRQAGVHLRSLPSAENRGKTGYKKSAEFSAPIDATCRAESAYASGSLTWRRRFTASANPSSTPMLCSQLMQPSVTD